MAIEMKTWTVARFPDGSWTYGGPPDSPDYTEAEIWRVPAYSAKFAVKYAQGQRRSMIRRQKREAERAATPSGCGPIGETE